MTRNIIDISHWDNSVDFAKVSTAGIVAVIAKATTGTTGVDPMFSQFKNDAIANGLLWGSYHFATAADPEDQVNHYLATAIPQPDHLVAIDFEPNPYGPTMSLAQLRDFVSIFKSKTGRYPVLYSGVSIKEALGSNLDPVLSACPLWLAQYGTIAVYPPAWDQFTLWQYTDGADGLNQVPGIGRCDRNQYNGSDAQLRTSWPLS